MDLAVDDEWYWLRKIYEALTQVNVLTDYVVPVATTLLAAAAIYLAYRSYKAAKIANDNTMDFRKEDRDERDLRWRRTFVVDLRDWFQDARFDALFQEYTPESKEAFRRLMRKCDRAGQDNAKRLARWLSREVEDRRAQISRMTPKEQALARHPSRMLQVDPVYEEKMSEFIREPTSVAKFLTTAEENHSRMRAAKLEAIMRDAVGDSKSAGGPS